MDDAIARIKLWKVARNDVAVSMESLYMESGESLISSKYETCDALCPETGY